MAGPWENYAEPEPETGPWGSYAQESQSEAPQNEDQFYGPQFSIGPVNIAPLRLMGLAGVAGLRGLEGTLGAPGDLMNLVHAKLGIPNAENSFPTSGGIADWLKTLGIDSNPESLQPQSSTERYLSGGAEGGGAALPLVPFFGPGALMSGVTGGLAATGAGELTGDNPLAMTAGGLLGGLLTPGSVIAAMSGKGTAEMLKAAEEELKEAQLARGENIAKAQEAAQSVASKMAQKYGPGEDFHSAGSTVQQAARDWLSGVDKAEGNAWAPVTKAAGDGQASVGPLVDHLDSLSALGGDSAATAQRAVGLMPKGLREAVGTAGLAEDGAVPSASWSDWRQFQHNIQNAMRKPGSDLAGDSGKAMDALHSTVIGQMGQMADSAGVFPEFADALAHSAQTTDIHANIIPKLISGAAPSSADVAPGTLVNGFANSLRQGPGSLQRLSLVSPDAAKSVASAVLQPQEDAAFASNSGLRAWARLSDDAKEALVPNAADRAALEDALSSYNGAGAAESAKIGKLKDEVNSLRSVAAGNPQGETNELLRVLSFENLAGPLAHGLGITPGLATIAPAVRASLPTIMRIARRARQQPSRLAGGLAAGNALGGGEGESGE